MKHVRIEYRLRDDVDLDSYAAAVTEFVGGIRAHAASSEYTSYRDAKDPRHFVHVGHFDESIVADLQAQAFFQRFTARQREASVAPADVTMLLPVASTK
jgi:quinol monooxygenase YgiN